MSKVSHFELRQINISYHCQFFLHSMVRCNIVPIVSALHAQYAMSVMRAFHGLLELIVHCVLALEPVGPFTGSIFFSNQLCVWNIV